MVSREFICARFEQHIHSQEFFGMERVEVYLFCPQEHSATTRKWRMGIAQGTSTGKRRRADSTTKMEFDSLLLI
jgi:hypothetical protein